ncbi:major facilitator superfamily domain-containing protein [Bisporella sp. PMI_857]|nr:major facilitator superfamily domain-containing protein [Bisporella sp. PMI_857]
MDSIKVAKLVQQQISHELDLPKSPVSHLEKQAAIYSQETHDDDVPVPHLHAKTFLAVFAVCLIYVAQLINIVGSGSQAQNIVAVVGGTTNSVWPTSAITIMTVVLSPIVSQAADYWGRRWFLILLTLCGAIGSIVVARASSIGMAIAGFTITGLSYGAQPLLHTVTSEVLPRRYRPWAQAADNVSAALGGIVAIFVGGSLTRHSNPAGFRNYWYISMAVYTIATVLTFLLYNPPPTKRQTDLTTQEKLANLDWVGYVILSAGIVLFCMSLSWSQNPYPWSNAHISAPFAIGVALIIALVVYETIFKKDGMLHHGLFKNGRNFPIALFCVFVEGLVFFAANNYFPFQASLFYETDPLRTGARFSITFFGLGVASIFTGLYCSKTKNIRWPTVAAFIFMIIFFICMATSNTTTSGPVWVYPAFLGIGLGLCLCSLITVAQLSTPKELIAITSGLMIGVRSLGGSVGLAIYNAILSSILNRDLGSNIAKAVLPLGLPATSLGEFIGYLSTQNTKELMAVEGVTIDIIEAGAVALSNTFVVGFRYIWVAAGCFTLLAVIGAFFLSDVKQEFNMHIDAPTEKQEDLYPA